MKGEVEQNSLFEQIKDQTYQNAGRIYEDFFEKNDDNFDVMGKDFLEHQIDVSIN